MWYSHYVAKFTLTQYHWINWPPFQLHIHPFFILASFRIGHCLRQKWIYLPYKVRYRRSYSLWKYPTSWWQCLSSGKMFYIFLTLNSNLQLFWVLMYLIWETSTKSIIVLTFYSSNLVISKNLQILDLQPRISKDFLYH